MPETEPGSSVREYMFLTTKTFLHALHTLVRRGQRLERGSYKPRVAGAPEAGRAKDIAQDP